jgi:uncharacterized membrane protein YphA (DoxX/SURF4 family)
MGGIKKFGVILGRACLSLIFIIAAYYKIIDWAGSEEALMAQLNQGINAYQNIEWLHDLIDYMIPWSSILLLVALVFELMGALLVFLGIKVRLGAILLILFIIPTTFFFHPFWTLTGADKRLQMTMFMQNISVLGGLLLVLAYGALPRKSQGDQFSEA